MLLSIEKLVYGGDGIARGPDKTIFVPFVLEGEQVEAQIIEERHGFARALLMNVVSSSPKRLEPQCPYFARCGGCHYQHTGYEHQLEIKSAILRETLRRIGKLDWAGEITLHPSPPWNYRNRTRMRIMREPEFSLAYFRFGSHQPLAIAECPISSPLINRAIGAINELGKKGNVPSEIVEFEFFADADDRHLMLELSCDSASPSALAHFAHSLSDNLPQIVSIAALHSSNPRQSHGPASPSKLLHGTGSLSYRAAGREYLVGAGSFFQTNRHMAETLASLATEGRAGRLAIDLYAGVGLFTLPLSQSFQQVIAVESAPSAAEDLRHNAPANAKAIEQPVDRFLASREAQRLRPDFVIVDPPRAGLGERVACQLAALAAPRITYVSCDPATLARDLHVLTRSQCAIEQIHLVDLFPQTFHIETITYLAYL